MCPRRATPLFAGRSKGAPITRIRLAELVAGPVLVGTAPAAGLHAGTRAARQGDVAIALREFEPLARAGNPLAQYDLGRMYRRSDRVRQDDREAFAWSAKAVEQGLAAAPSRIGRMYANGIGIARDPRKAAIWTGAAARQRDREAKANLAAICQDLGWAYPGGTDGNPQDRAGADVWLSLAAENGSTEGRELRDAAGDPAGDLGQLDRARRMLAACKASGPGDCVGDCVGDCD